MWYTIASEVWLCIAPADCDRQTNSQQNTHAEDVFERPLLDSFNANDPVVLRRTTSIWQNNCSVVTVLVVFSCNMIEYVR